MYPRARPQFQTMEGKTMHDAKGRELKEGDLVLIPARVKTLSPGEDYCNVSVETTLGRRPDDAKETIHAINTGVLLRANAGDDNGGAELEGFSI
jgi:hypothetical protein